MQRRLRLSFWQLISLAAACLAVACSTPKPKKEKPAPPPRVRPAPKIQTQNVIAPETQIAANVFSQNRDAVVKILLKKHNHPTSFGAGFFISADGKLITNRHVISDLLGTPGATVEFQLADGKTVISRYGIGGCGDEREIDLCVLKLDHRPARWIQLAPAEAKPGEKVFVIGHPEGFEYSFSDGIISAVRELEYGIKFVQFTASISQGNSGGPVLDQNGQLLGIATKFAVEGQNLNFAIASSEIVAYVNAHSKFVPRALFQDQDVAKLILTLKSNTMRSWASPLEKPAAALEAQEKAPKIGDPVTYQFPVGSDTLYLPTPNGLFAECTEVAEVPQKAGGCRDLRTRSAFIVSLMPRLPLPLLKMEGKLPEAPRVHDIDPQAAGTPPGASLPFPRTCRKANEFRANTFAGRSDGVCFSMIRNYGKPGSFKLITEIEVQAQLYTLVFASDEPRLFDYAKAWMRFAAYNAVSETLNGTSSRAPASENTTATWPFSVTIPNRYREFSTKESSSGPIYTAKAENSTYFLSIIPVRPGVPVGIRKKFRAETIADETSLQGAGPNRPKIDKKTAVVKDLENGNGFILAGRGALESSRLMIFQGVVYFGDTTYVVSGIAPWEKRSEASPEFTRVLRSLKPK